MLTRLQTYRVLCLFVLIRRISAGILFIGTSRIFIRRTSLFLGNLRPLQEDVVGRNLNKMRILMFLEFIIFPDLPPGISPSQASGYAVYTGFHVLLRVRRTVSSGDLKNMSLCAASAANIRRACPQRTRCTTPLMSKCGGAVLAAISRIVAPEKVILYRYDSLVWKKCDSHTKYASITRFVLK